MPGSILPTVRENTSRMVGTQERPRTTATALSTCRAQRDAGVFPAKFLYSSSQSDLPHFGQRYSIMFLYTVRKNSVPISLFLLPVGTFPEWPHPFLCPVTSNPPTTSVKSFIYVISVFILPHLFFVISFCFFFLAFLSGGSSGRHIEIRSRTGGCQRPPVFFQPPRRPQNTGKGAKGTCIWAYSYVSISVHAARGGLRS